MSRSVTVPDAIRPAPPSGGSGMGKGRRPSRCHKSLKGSRKPSVCGSLRTHGIFDAKRPFQSGSQVASGARCVVIAVRADVVAKMPRSQDQPSSRNRVSLIPKW